MCNNSQEMNESIDFVYINRHNHQMVDEHYPNTDKFVRVDRETAIFHRVENEKGSCAGCVFLDTFKHVCCFAGGWRPRELSCYKEASKKHYIYELKK